VRARLATRWRPALALLLPALGGLAYLAAFGAPGRLIIVNALALALGLAWTIWGRVPLGDRFRIGLAAVAAGLLFVPQLTGPDVGGAARWLPAGPVLLHSGALLLPLLTVLAASAPRAGPWLLALATLALALQPDAGALAGLGAASAALAWARRSVPFALVAGASLILAAATFHAGTREPQAYTEGVLAHVWPSAPLAALALAALLLLAPGWLLIRPACSTDGAGPALAALLTGFTLAAILGPFPFPLIGYGASPILGFALAIGALAGNAAARGNFHASP
jgi:cell division protein FtsW (lipid II flippase)